MNIKKLVSALLVLSMLMSVLSALSFYAAAADVKTVLMDSEAAGEMISVYSENMAMGDVTGDGNINALDSFELKKYILGYPTNARRFTIDADGDGMRNALDLFQIKLVIVQKAVKKALGNTTVTKAYDENEAALKLSVNSSGTTDALFDIDASSVSFSDYGFVAVVWRGNDKAEIGFVDEYHYTEYSSNVITSDNDGYNYAIASVPASRMESDIIEVKYGGSPNASDELMIDSIIFADTAAEAEAAANERLAVRNKPKEFKYVTINFDRAEMLSHFTASESTTVAYDENEGVVRFMAPTPNADPYAVLELENYGISADEYKYIVYTSMVPSGRSDPMPNGEIYFCVGDVTEPAERYSSMFSNIDDGFYHSSIFEMTNADFWKGTVHSLRLDYFDETNEYGYSHYLKSIVFCDSYEAAQAVCVDRETITPDVRQLFSYGLYTQGEMRLSYRLYVPYDYDGVKKYPVLTFLHGAGQRGNDGIQQVEAIVPYFFDDPATDAAYNSIVIVPQCPLEYKWVECEWGLGRYSVDEVQESEPMKAYLNVLDGIKKTYKVDNDRFYITGFSMGGYGTWDLLTRHGELYAAGMPLCGGGDRTKAELLVDIPIRTFHGTDDSLVPVYATKQMYNAIRALRGTKINYTEMAGYPHDIWTDVYNDSSNIAWLFSHRLSDRTK